MRGAVDDASPSCTQAVFLLEPSLDPALEAQAAARVHRMGERTSNERMFINKWTRPRPAYFPPAGQTLPTRVVRFITPNSIEEAVLRLQESKPSSGLSLLNATATAAASATKKVKGAGGTEALAAEAEFQDMLKVVKTLLRPVGGETGR